MIEDGYLDINKTAAKTLKLTSEIAAPFIHMYLYVSMIGNITIREGMYFVKIPDFNNIL